MDTTRYRVFIRFAGGLHRATIYKDAALYMMIECRCIHTLLEIMREAIAAAQKRDQLLAQGGSKMYKIVRHFFRDDRKRTIAKGLTLEEVRAHCKSPEASSKTATRPEATRRTKRYGAWFDGYSET